MLDRDAPSSQGVHRGGGVAVVRPHRDGPHRSQLRDNGVVYRPHPHGENASGDTPLRLTSLATFPPRFPSSPPPSHTPSPPPPTHPHRPTRPSPLPPFRGRTSCALGAPSPYPPTSPPLPLRDPRSPLRPFFPPHHARPPAQTPSARPPPLPPRCRPMQSPTPIASQYGAAPLPPRSPRTPTPPSRRRLRRNAHHALPTTPLLHSSRHLSGGRVRMRRIPCSGKHSNAASLPNAADYHALYHWSSTILRPLNEACNTKPPLCRRVPGRPPRPRPPSLAVAPTHARARDYGCVPHPRQRPHLPTPFRPPTPLQSPRTKPPSHPGPRRMHGNADLRARAISPLEIIEFFFSCASPSRCSSS